MLRRILITLVLAACCTPAWGQRVRGRVVLPDTEPLRFDVNDLPLTTLGVTSGADLNFSPNIVFTPDSTRGFVSYPGSSKVMAFDVDTAEVLQFIEVGKNPALITATPDGSRIAVVSLSLAANVPKPGESFRGERIGSISMIDVETLEVRTLNLQEVFFSFANNIVFSADGATGFIASAGTDEIIRFNTATMAEITPRLKMDGGTRPASITMAPDSSFFTVVLVGSNALPQAETPDSVQLIDPDGFRVIGGIVPAPREVSNQDGTTTRIPHNFFSTNTVAISGDGKFGLIGDNENSLVSIIPEFSGDHAILLDLENREVVRVLNVGGVSGPAAWIPGRDVFAIVSAVGVDLIDPQLDGVLRGAESQSFYRQTSRPAFSLDGSRIFLGSPVLDRINNFDSRTGSLRNLVGVRGDFNSGIANVGAGTLHVSLSPDGRTLAAVNFNANNIVLLKNTLRIVVPEFRDTTEWFTGAAVANHSQLPAEVIASGVAPTGLPYLDDPATEEEVEVVNPKVLDLEAGQQVAFTPGGLFEAAPGVVLEGWLDLDTDAREIGALFLHGDLAVRRMDGGLAIGHPSQSIVLPEFQFENGFSTELTVVNNNLNSVDVAIAVVKSDGERLIELPNTLNTSGRLTRLVVAPEDDPDQNALIDRSLLEEGETYYLIVGAIRGVMAFEKYYDDERMAILNGIPVIGPDAVLYDRLFAPHVAFSGSARSHLKVINISAEDAQVTLRIFGNDGAPLADPVEREMASGSSLRENVTELFGLEETPLPASGWVEVVSDQLGLVGSVEIEVFGGKALTALPLQPSLDGEIVFSHVAQGFGFTTGLALLGLGEEMPLTVTVHQTDGSVVGQLELSLGEGRRLLGLVGDLFPGLPEMNGGYIRASGGTLVGAQIFFKDDLELMATVPAQSRAGLF